jgi:hypothetical protein
LVLSRVYLYTCQEIDPMRNALGGAALLLTLALCVPSATYGQKKPVVKDTVASDQDYTQLTKELVGKLSSVENSTKVIALKVDYQYLEPNPNANKANRGLNQQQQRQQQQILRQQQQILKSKNPVQRLQQMQNLVNNVQQQQVRGALALNNMFRVAKATKEFELQAQDNVKVRRLNLPTEYDDKGNIKEYTAEEKKALRGNDPKLPGYTATWEDVSPNQSIKVFLVKKKPAKKEATTDSKKDDAEATAGAKDSKTTAGAEKDTKTTAAGAKDSKTTTTDKTTSEKGSTEASAKDSRPEVWMILIMSEPDPTATTAPPRKKKNNN